jgi:hypothetical protein
VENGQTFPLLKSNRELIYIIVISFLICWIITGSTGFLVHPLKNIIALLGVISIIIISFSYKRPKLIFFVLQIVTFGISILLFIFWHTQVIIPGLAMILASIACGRENHKRRVFLSLSFVIFCYGLYRFILTSNGSLWIFFDVISSSLSSFAGFITGNKLKTGMTFAGIDYLLLTLSWYLMCLLHNSKKKLQYGLIWISIILLSHFIYLIIITGVPGFLSLLPKSDGETIPPVTLFFQKAIPWNLPVIALLIHLVLSSLLYIFSDWNDVSLKTKLETNKVVCFIKKYRLGYISAILFSIIISLLIYLFSEKAEFKGKKAVLYEKGYLNWLRPQHGDYGRLSIGMYGNLPDFIMSLGAEVEVTPDLSRDNLSDADLLILIYPNEPWEKGQLERIWNFVRSGGSLLVMGEHTVLEKDGRNRINEVIEPSSIRVNFDSTMFAIGGWLHSYETLSHPITNGIADDRNQFGIVVGASLDISWPARPLIIGKWGYADYGDRTTASMMGNSTYDSGEKLGDLVLVAEQQIGKGKIIVFGDTSSLSNGIIIGAHPFVARLFAYLADRGHFNNASLRFTLAFIVGIILIALLFLLHDPLVTFLCAVGYIVPLIVCLYLNNSLYNMYPQRSEEKGIKISYIDFSHNNISSAESWRLDGTMGLSLNLFRNGYLNFALAEFQQEKLEQAHVFVCIAPQSTISHHEVKSLKDLVYDGLILIINAGYKERYGCENLLKAFGFGYHGMYTEAESHILKENRPEPMGFFKSPYLYTGDYYVFVRFFAGWPITCDARDSEILAYGYRDLPMIIMRRFGKGKVVFIGDSYFSTNQNLELESGEPFEGMRENVHFWRWFLTYLNDRPMWIPPNPRQVIKTETE